MRIQPINYHLRMAKIQLLFLFLSPQITKNNNDEESNTPCVPLLHAHFMQ